MAYRDFAELSGAYRFLREPGPWLWGALALGLAVRLFFVFATPGTDDVPIWQSHAGWTATDGMLAYYEWQEVFNHPPFIGFVHAKMWEAARAMGIPFRIPLRLPYTLLDLGSALLLARIFRASPHRWLVAALYWLNPLAIIFSSYHGNTDTAVAFFCLLAVMAAGEGRVAAAGAALGVGAWIKLPVTLAVWPVFFFFESWRARGIFLAVFLAVGASTYLPVAFTAWDLLVRNVLTYPGLHIHTPGGVPIWGIWHVFGLVDALPDAARFHLHGIQAFHEDHNRLVTLAPILLLAWLRRGESDARGLGLTVCGGLLLFHGLTNFWAWQYLAWLVPFLYFGRPLLPILGTLLLGGFIYAVYAMLCGDPFLLGRWDFKGWHDWPLYLLALRDASVLFCLFSGGALLVTAARRAWREGRKPEAPA